MAEKRVPPVAKDVDQRLRLAPPLPARTTPLNVDEEIEAFHANWKKNMMEDAEQLAKGKKNFPKGEHILEDIADDKHLED